MSEAVAVAVVGCGYWGPNLIRNLLRTSGAVMKSVCDLKEERLAHMKSLYPGVTTTRNIDEVLGDPDIHAMFIATPVSRHFEMAHAALSAGKHVFLEKPMARSVSECEQLCTLAEERGLTLMVGHTFLYSAPVRRIKKIIQDGDLGILRYISARRLNLGLFQKDINVTWDLAPHDLSIILYLMSASPVALNCVGSRSVDPNVEDVTNLSLFFARGDYATVHSSWLDPRKVRDMTVVGSRRMIVYDDLEPLHKIRIYDMHVECPPHYDTFAEFQYAYHYGDMYAPLIQQEEPLKVQCQHFVDCIRNRARPISDGRQGLALVQILEAATQSLANNGARVELCSHEKVRAAV